MLKKRRFHIWRPRNPFFRRLTSKCSWKSSSLAASLDIFSMSSERRAKTSRPSMITFLKEVT